MQCVLEGMQSMLGLGGMKSMLGRAVMYVSKGFNVC